MLCLAKTKYRTLTCHLIKALKVSGQCVCFAVTRLGHFAVIKIPFTQRLWYKDTLKISSLFRLHFSGVHSQWSLESAMLPPQHVLPQNMIQRSAVWRQSINSALWFLASNKSPMYVVTDSFIESALNKTWYWINNNKFKFINSFHLVVSLTLTVVDAVCSVSGGCLQQVVAPPGC